MKTINKRIEVIAIHSETGQITPKRFRTDAEGEFKAYDINVKETGESKIEKERVFSYRCEFQDGDYTRECELRFHTNGTYWTLFRI